MGIKWGGITYKIKYKWGQFKRKLVCWLYRARDLLVFYIPSDHIRDLPKTQALPVGLIAVLALLTFSVFLLVSTIMRNLSTSYLSLEQDSSSVCEEVLRPLDNEFLADQDGYWEGSVEFNYSRALYRYHARIQRDYESYVAGATSLIDDVFNGIGALMSRNNLGINLLLLATYQSEASNSDETDTFSFTANPVNLYDTGVYSSSFGTIDSFCEATFTTSFDKANANINVMLSYEEFINSSACMNVVDPKHLGYDTQWSGDKFSIDLDVNTLASVIAVNLGIVPTHSFEPMVPNPNEDLHGGTRYFYTRFGGMDPFVCYIYPHDENSYYCAMKVGSILAIPYFNHGGFNYTYPSYCDCADDKWRQSQECNLFHFLSGLLFYDFNSTESEVDSLNRLHELMFQSTSSGLLVNRKVYDISYDINNVASTTRGNQTWKDSHFEFCRSSDGRYCSLLSVYKYSTSQSVTDYHYQLFNGSCNNFISMSDEASARYIYTPPTPLVEDYVKCKRTVFAAVTDSVGVVNGTISAVTPMLMFAIFYIYFYGYIHWKGIQQEVTYSKQELQDISRFLVFNLALARDGLHPTQQRAESAGEGNSADDHLERQSILQDSVLLRLLEELKQEDVYNRFHVPLKNDSDVEDDEKESIMMSNPMVKDERGMEMSRMEGGESLPTKKKKRKKKKTKPIRTDPDIILNPMVYQLNE